MDTSAYIATGDREAQLFPSSSGLSSGVVAEAPPFVRLLARRSDVQLVALIAGGEGDALGELYDRHATIAYRLALRVVRDPGLAEEAVQDAFLSVWRSAGSFDVRRGAARSWLLTLVHRRAVDLLQRALRHHEQPSASLPDRAGRSSAAMVELANERRRVRGALDDLPFPQRQALELAYYGGLSQSQIAEQVGVPIGTITSRTYLALTAMRDAL
jgi:RNA polymerase sigma-70 factor, ECF subfamily